MRSRDCVAPLRSPTAKPWFHLQKRNADAKATDHDLKQWLQYFEALQIDWTAEDEAAVNALVAPGHPSTPGFNDPRYPLAQRLAAP